MQNLIELSGHYILIQRWLGRFCDGWRVIHKSSIRSCQHRKRSLKFQQLKPCHPSGRGTQPSTHPLGQRGSLNDEHKSQSFCLCKALGHEVAAGAWWLCVALLFVPRRTSGQRGSQTPGAQDFSYLAANWSEREMVLLMVGLFGCGSTVHSYLREWLIS